MNNITDSYGRDLDLNLLRVFTVVAEAGSITRAAQRLYVTQPAVSAAMRRLSEVVEAELFTRQGRGMVLTPRGAELFAATRAYLGPLVAAALAAPVFEPKRSTATVRVGLVDGCEPVFLPALLALLAKHAPLLQVIALPVHFRNVEELLLGKRVDMALCVVDALPRSILRKPLGTGDLVCLFDARFCRLPKKPTARDYFACEHVAVSYAGDARGVVEDSGRRARNVRVSVASFSFVADVVDGSALVGTVPAPLARHLSKTRPHLKILPLPVKVARAELELLWLRANDADPLNRFLREALERVVSAN